MVFSLDKWLLVASSPKIIHTFICSWNWKTDIFIYKIGLCQSKKLKRNKKWLVLPYLMCHSQDMAPNCLKIEIWGTFSFLYHDSGQQKPLIFCNDTLKKTKIAKCISGFKTDHFVCSNFLQYAIINYNVNILQKYIENVRTFCMLLLICISAFRFFTG